MSGDTVVILGRGRCGTSAVAGVIDRLGIDFTGIKDMVFSNHLLRGYYEKEEVSDFTNSQCGSNEFKTGEPTEEFKEAFKKFKGKGVKNHRVIYLVPWILKEDPNTKIIVCSRDIKKQAKSINDACWNKRKSFKKIKKSIEDYQKEIEQLGVKYLEVKFKDLMENTEQEVKRIAEYIGKKPTKEAIRFIKPKYSKYGY